MSRIIPLIHAFAYALYRIKVPVIPYLIQLFIYLAFNCHVPYKLRMGKKVKFAYGGIGVVIHERAVIGDRVIIGQGVTIGGRGGASLPVISDGVFLGAGSRILGGVAIGENTIVAPNAVVINDVASDSVVGGIPARYLRKDSNS
ncbi:serine acetyltransferase [uncultured Ferrimonas sp.]|uniref:serine O-acetyltransferase n=1 Tax=uncultured Ferrimonas sp. TaxID=432640 RepID=UPI00261E2E18|nr:serine acetyltransferase [uncultured Ferrimonas sp.]